MKSTASTDNNNLRRIGLETSSLMPLLEITTRTLPLQKQLKSVVGKAVFIIDQFSVDEAKAQIALSFNNAVEALGKAKLATERLDAKNVNMMSWIFAKCLAEPIFGGRHEILRWADVISDSLDQYKPKEDFFTIVGIELHRKKNNYLRKLTVRNGILEIDCNNILPYWVTPQFVRDLKFSAQVSPNELDLLNFYKLLIAECPKLSEINVGVNDMNDIYHLYSLNKDSGISEIWTCNQKFVKRHEEYLAGVKAFAYLFNPAQTKIVRIK